MEVLRLRATRKSTILFLTALGACTAALSLLTLAQPSGEEGERTVPTVAGTSQTRVGPFEEQTSLTMGPGQEVERGPQVLDVASPDEWYAAVAQVRPGDTIRLVRTIHTELVYQADTDGEERPGSSGTADAPITITAAEGVWIDPDDLHNNKGALDIRQADHIRVVGVRVRNSQFGIRLLEVSGTRSSPSAVVGSTVTNTGHNAIKIGAQFQTMSESSFILIEGNTVSDTGQTVGRFGEGIYIGKGGAEYAWKDETHDIVVRNNTISRTTAEAIDVKPGTRDIVVEGNKIFDVSPIDGGAISAHYSNYPDPNPNELDRLTIRGNLIWNQNLENVNGSNDWAIWVGQGGVTIEDNKIWGMRDTPSTRAIRVRSPVGFGPHPITVRDNVLWAAAPLVVDGSEAEIASGIALLQSSSNIGPSEGPGVSLVTAEQLVGPVPPIGKGGSADNGAGPGSGFAIETNSPPESTSSSTITIEASAFESTPPTTATSSEVENEETDEAASDRSIVTPTSANGDPLPPSTLAGSRADSSVNVAAPPNAIPLVAEPESDPDVVLAPSPATTWLLDRRPNAATVDPTGQFGTPLPQSEIGVGDRQELPVAISEPDIDRQGGLLAATDEDSSPPLDSAGSDATASLRQLTLSVSEAGQPSSWRRLAPIYFVIVVIAVAGIIWRGAARQVDAAAHQGTVTIRGTGTIEGTTLIGIGKARGRRPMEPGAHDRFD